MLLLDVLVATTIILVLASRYAPHRLRAHAHITLTNEDWAQVGSWAPDVELPSEALRKLMLEKLAKEGVERM
eukprot:354234-Chlamydomonas_euryale.AAC.18